MKNKEVSKDEGPSNPSKHKNSRQSKTFSVSLTQALLTSDKKLLEKLLSTNDTTSIEDTVADLTPPLVISLLDFISKNLVKSPNQLYSREGWINTLLRTHSSFFTNNKKGREALMNLNKHINQRLSTNKALLKLKGKVDSVVYMSSLYNKKRHKDSMERMSSQEPLVTFTEDET